MFFGKPVWKYDSKPWWEHVVQTDVPEDKIFLPLAQMHYKLAPIIPAEGVVERFSLSLDFYTVRGVIVYQRRTSKLFVFNTFGRSHFWIHISIKELK